MEKMFEKGFGHVSRNGSIMNFDHELTFCSSLAIGPGLRSGRVGPARGSRGLGRVGSPKWQARVARKSPK